MLPTAQSDRSVPEVIVAAYAWIGAEIANCVGSVLLHQKHQTGLSVLFAVVALACAAVALHYFAEAREETREDQK